MTQIQGGGTCANGLKHNKITHAMIVLLDASWQHTAINSAKKEMTRNYNRVLVTFQLLQIQR